MGGEFEGEEGSRGAGEGGASHAPVLADQQGSRGQRHSYLNHPGEQRSRGFPCETGFGIQASSSPCGHRQGPPHSRFSSGGATRGLMKAEGRVGLCAAPGRRVRAKQLTALLSRGGPLLALKSGRGGCRPSVPPKPFFGSTWPPLMPCPRGPRPDVLKVAPASSPGPVPGHRPLIDRPTEAGTGHRAAPEVLEGPDPSPPRVSPHVRQGGPRNRDLRGSGTGAQELFLVWPRCPAHSSAPDGKTLVG